MTLSSIVLPQMLILRYQQIRMRVILVILLVVFVSQIKLAQTLGNDVRFFDDRVSRSVYFGGYGYFGSAVFDNQTINLFNKGGFFDNDLKDQSLKRLGGQNILGGEYGFQLAYSDPCTQVIKNYGFYVNYSVDGGTGINFSSDLFKLVFVGNQDFVGDSAVLSGTEMSLYQYKKIGFGLTDNERMKIGLSLLTFSNYAYGTISNGQLIIDENLDSMSLRLHSKFNYAKSTSNSGPIGYGIGADFESSIPYNEDTLGIPRMVFGVRNLGLFFSTKSMSRYQVDSTYSYKGFEVNSLSGFQESLFVPAEIKDSLLPQNDTGRIFRALPFEIYFYSVSNPNGKKLQLVYGMRYRYGVQMIPMVYIGGDWRPNKNTIISGFLNFGGYSFVKTGLSIRKQFNHLKIGLNFNNLPGFLTKEAYNRSLALSMNYVFG